MGITTAACIAVDAHEWTLVYWDERDWRETRDLCVRRRGYGDMRRTMFGPGPPLHRKIVRED